MYSMFYLKEANKYIMGKIEWKIRFLWRMVKNSERMYYEKLGWHAYADSPEVAADKVCVRVSHEYP